MMEQLEKVIIVEGRSDKQKVERLLQEPIEIICTNGTIGTSKLDELVDAYEHHEVYILVDADASGEKLRKTLRREFPEANHLYIDKTYREVAAAPSQHVAAVLLSANLPVRGDQLVK